jgi:SAM-dependent methyltransferase
MRLVYTLYLRLFGGKSSPYQISERIVEYPFAVQAITALPKASRVVIFGCHGDLLTTLLPSLGYQTFGVDIKEFPQRFANFEFRREDIRHTSFEDAVFDATVAISTLEHVGLFDNDEHGDASTVREIQRVLKPGGLFVLSVPFASRSVVIPLFERIYDEPRLMGLLDGFTIESMTAYELVPGSLWTPVAIDRVPPPKSATECTALVAARKAI